MPVDLVKPALEGLRATFGGAVREAAILSTCNRTELSLRGRGAGGRASAGLAG